MEKGALIDKAVALAGAGFELDYEILANKSGMPIIGFNNSNATIPIDTLKKKSLKQTP